MTKEEAKENLTKNIARLRRRFLSNRGRFQFKISESRRYARVKDRWRAPRGIDSRMRLKMRGYRTLPSIGYRTPKSIRGFHPSGFEKVLVCSVKDVDKVDPHRQAVMIAHTVSKRKRLRILEEANKRKVRVLNPPKVESVGIEKPKEISSERAESRR